MAKFILDGQEYGGGSGSKIVKLTQAEYDALPNDKLSDDIIYLIKDSGELTAENLFYDGSETGLGNTVQDAVDNLDEKVSEQNKNIDKVKKWTLHQQVVGTVNIPLPMEYEELLAIIDIPFSQYTVTCSIVIPKNSITSTIKYFDSGSENTKGRIGVSTSGVVLNTASANAVAFLNTATVSLYYR